MTLQRIVLSAAFDFGTTTGFALARTCDIAKGSPFTSIANGFGKDIDIIDPRRVEVLYVDDIQMTNEFRSKATKGDAVRAKVHSQTVWMDWTPEVLRRLKMTSLHCDDLTGNAPDPVEVSVIVCYEQVNFAKSVFWAQLYGGMLASMLIAANSMCREATIIPVNVASVKKQICGSGGADEKMMHTAIDRYLSRTKPGIREYYDSTPVSSRHNMDDAVAVALAGIQKFSTDICETTKITR